MSKGAPDGGESVTYSTGFFSFIGPRFPDRGRVRRIARSGFFSSHIFLTPALTHEGRSKITKRDLRLR